MSTTEATCMGTMLHKKLSELDDSGTAYEIRIDGGTPVAPFDHSPECLWVRTYDNRGHHKDAFVNLSLVKVVEVEELA